MCLNSFTLANNNLLIQITVMMNVKEIKSLTMTHVMQKANVMTDFASHPTMTSLFFHVHLSHLSMSLFCELEWFKWVIFLDETAPFPDDVLKLGNYLGPSIDVGPAMTAKLLTENGQVLHRSTNQPLTPD